MFSLFAVLGHVPTYGSADQKCIQPPHHHTTSQAVYLKGSGGLEVHTKSDTDPFDTSGELIDFDAVFRKKYPQDWFDLYIGCGGCVSGVDPVVISPFELDPWDHGTIEPFTQTAYYSPILKARRKFNSTLLSSKLCNQSHFSIRLVVNSKAEEDIVWSAVIGLGETFTFVELLSFPVYVLLNHGPTWNDADWTWIVALACAPLLMLLVRATLKACRVRVDAELVTIKDWKLVIFFDDWREVLYEIAIIGFVAMAIEETIHLIIATQGISDVNSLLIGLFAVILIPNGLGIALALNNWTALRFRKQLFMDKDWPANKRCSKAWYKLSSNPWLAPLEIATGFSFFFLFGAGCFVGPAALMITGCIRFADLRHSKYVNVVTTGYVPAAKRSKQKETQDGASSASVDTSKSAVAAVMPGIYI